jgi:hypothetical protein
MSRPKSPDPAERVVISLPRSLKRTARATANGKRISLSAWICELIREYFQRAEKALR